MKVLPAIYIIAFFLTPAFLISQPNIPEKGVVFDDTSVPRVDILIHPDTLNWIYNNVESYTEWRATFIFQREALTDTLEDVGFRLRGNTSRYSAKKSFKISFNTFQPGRKWHGLEKLNLNGEHNDPSIMRSKLSWDIVREMGLPGPRCNHVRVYINGNFYGVYVNVEHIDEEFVKSRFNNNDGNLFKCLYPADLKYKGNNPDLYKEVYGSRRAYDLKTNTGLDDYTDIAQFINLLNNTPDGDFYCEITRVLNVFSYLKAAAIDVFIANWDGYIYNKNNFYLYHNSGTNKFEYLHYDLDNTYGIDWFGKEWSQRDIYDWEQHGSEVRPLYTRMIENQELKDLYSATMNHLIDQITNPEVLFPRLNQLRDMIAPFVAIDPYYPLDYGYNIDDFYNSFEEPVGAHVEKGIKQYINERRESANDQLVLNPTIPVIQYIKYNYPLPGEDCWIAAVVTAEQPLQSVAIKYQLNGGPVQYTIMHDDGNHHDQEAGDGIYGAMIQGITMNNSLSWQITASDEFGLTNTLPCEPVFIQFEPSEEPAIYINEFMADNETFLADEAGQYDDWIEIYNGDTEAVWMGDKYLTDNPDNPDKWLFPDVTIQPGEYIVVWADEDQGQGLLHTNFKLDAAGEYLGLFDAQSTAFFPLDTLTYGEQVPDMVFGRFLDGGLPWMYLNTPTPGSTNETNAVDQPEAGRLLVYPNPVVNGWLFLSKPASGKIFDLQGRALLTFNSQDKIEINKVKPGLYILQLSDGFSTKITIQ